MAEPRAPSAVGVSVIVPAYNHERFVEHTLRGVLAQTHPRVELIVIDDGSSDGTWEKLLGLEAECRAKLDGFVARRKANEGISATLNLGVALARYEFLYIIASDDVPLPHAIETLLPPMLADDAVGVSAGEAEFIDGDGQPLERELGGVRYREFVKFHAALKTDFDVARDFGSYASFLDWNYMPNGNLYRKAQLLAAGGFNPAHMVEDWDAWLRLSRIAKFRFTNRVCTRYRVHGANTLSLRRFETLADTVSILLEQARYCAGAGHLARWERFVQELARSAFAQHRDEMVRQGAEIRRLDAEILRHAAEIHRLGTELHARAGEVARLQASILDHREDIERRQDTIGAYQSRLARFPYRVTTLAGAAWRLAFVPAARPEIIRLARGRIQPHFPRLWRLLQLVRRFIDAVRTTNLRFALTLAARKLAQFLRRKTPARPVAGAALEDLADIAHRGCRISVVVPVYNTPPTLLHECICSVLEQAYANWELCICDDSSSSAETREALETYRGSDPRIRIVRTDANQHISLATNLAAEQASGRFLAFLDHDDRLHPHALYEVAKADLAIADIDLLYTDEDKLDPAGRHCDAYYKPDWSPEHLDSVMYVLHMLTVRKSLFWELGGMRDEIAGAQDYDLALRAAAKARRVHHVDKVLYHWRINPGSAAGAVDAKPYARARARQALADSLRERRIEAIVEDGLFTGSFRVRQAIRGAPPVTLLILTNHATRAIAGRGEVDLLRNFLASIRARSTYAKHRIIVVDNGNASPGTRDWLREAGVRLESYSYAPPFNFPRKLNHALQFVDTEHVILLNDDLEVVTPGWIEALLEFSQRSEIGAVGARLLYPDGRVQHAGMVLGVNGAAAHIFHGLPKETVAYNGYSHLIRNYSAVTGAVLATRMEILRRLGGFDEALAVDYNDIDFCLRLREAGLRVVYTPFCQLLHFEGSTQKRSTQNPAEVELFNRRWAPLIARDPYYNTNLPRDTLNPSP